MSLAESRIKDAIAFHRQGRFDDAARLYEAALALEPTHFDALHLLGAARIQQGRFDEAIDLIGSALKLRSDSPDALCDIAFASRSVGRFDESIGYYDRALAARPGDMDLLFEKAKALAEAGRHAESIIALNGVIASNPQFVGALLARGNAALALNRGAEAAEDFGKALIVDPRSHQAIFGLARALIQQQRPEEALACFDGLLAASPDHAPAWNDRGLVLWSMNRHDDAILSYARAIVLSANFPQPFYNRGNAWLALNQNQRAIDDFDRALAIAPSFAEAHRSRGHALTNLNRLDEANAAYSRAVALNPTLPYALGYAVQIRAQLCDWSDYDANIANLTEETRKGAHACVPFTLLCFDDDPEDHLICAKTFVESSLRVKETRGAKVNPRHHERIRVAYFSADFHDHATAYLIAELFELHDRERFEILAVSFGPDCSSPIRERLRAGTDQFLDAGRRSDVEVAELMRDMKVGIAVDLKGHTQDARPGIFARRAAPIQVNYLGYPGTTGADFIDYIIADPIVIPKGDENYYTESVVRLPYSYQVNDSKRRIADRTPTRAELGLPEEGFVFCAFNGTFKITPSMFDIWMRILKRIDGSVLWLLRATASAENNLRREATNRGVDPKRLVFAPRIPLSEHLARHGVADLFLDTVPYNAHTTASDALWAGLPVLTCEGRSFASRVASSLLHAVRLPELVTRSLDEYELHALRLARDPMALTTLRERLAKDRLRTPLFESRQFRRNLETAYATMWRTHCAGQPPSAIDVEANDASVMDSEPANMR